MSETTIAEILLDLALLFLLTYLLSHLLARMRIPAILGALFIAMGLHYTPIGSRLLSRTIYPSLDFLAQLGVLFLLFFIGLQIDLKEMQKTSQDIIWLTILNTAMPFFLGVVVMLVLGYGWLIAFVIGLTRMPTAEAVIVPILDEFKLIGSRVGEFIIGAGVLDDIIEIFLVAFVSVWIGTKTGIISTNITGNIFYVVAGLLILIALTLITHWLLAKILTSWMPSQPSDLIMLGMLILFAFGGISEYFNLGMVIGAIIAGVLMYPTFNKTGLTGKQAMETIQSVSYGFLGLIFFFWVGLNVDLKGMISAPILAILLFLAAFIGKMIGVFMMVPAKKLNILEAWTIGIGLNARLTTEIIVAQLLLSAKIIKVDLFTALIAASSLSTIIVPLVFTLVVRRWSKKLSPLQ